MLDVLPDASLRHRVDAGRRLVLTTQTHNKHEYTVTSARISHTPAAQRTRTSHCSSGHLARSDSPAGQAAGRRLARWLSAASSWCRHCSFWSARCRTVSDRSQPAAARWSADRTAVNSSKHKQAVGVWQEISHCLKQLQMRGHSPPCLSPPC